MSSHLKHFDWLKIRSQDLCNIKTSKTLNSVLCIILALGQTKTYPGSKLIQQLHRTYQDTFAVDICVIEEQLASLQLEGQEVTLHSAAKMMPIARKKYDRYEYPFCG
jgi:hypothetical protein